MKKAVMKIILRQREGKKVATKRTLTAERAKIKLPYKPDHVTEEEVRRAVAELV